MHGGQPAQGARRATQYLQHTKLAHVVPFLVATPLLVHRAVQAAHEDRDRVPEELRAFERSGRPSFHSIADRCIQQFMLDTIFG
jgi:hypothetical protein